MMRHEQVDVLCLQEFLDDGEFPADSIGALFSRRMPYFVSEGNGAVVSRYPILDCKYVRFPDTSNDYLRADLLVEGDTLRIFSVHLQTSGIAQLRRRFQKDYNREAPVDSMLGAVDRNSRIRAAQVREIRAETDASPYPVILAGDFNDTPSSYTYREMKGALTDGFRPVRKPGTAALSAIWADCCVSTMSSMTTLSSAFAITCPPKWSATIRS